jgi:hypothetical protein
MQQIFHNSSFLSSPFHASFVFYHVFACCWHFHVLPSNVQHHHEIIFIASHNLVVVLIFFDIFIINKLM